MARNNNFVNSPVDTGTEKKSKLDKFFDKTGKVLKTINKYAGIPVNAVFIPFSKARRKALKEYGASALMGPALMNLSTNNYVPETFIDNEVVDIVGNRIKQQYKANSNEAKVLRTSNDVYDNKGQKVDLNTSEGLAVLSQQKQLLLSQIETQINNTLALQQELQNFLKLKANATDLGKKQLKSLTAKLHDPLSTNDNNIFELNNTLKKQYQNLLGYKVFLTANENNYVTRVFKSDKTLDKFSTNNLNFNDIYATLAPDIVNIIHNYANNNELILDQLSKYQSLYNGNTMQRSSTFANNKFTDTDISDRAIFNAIATMGLNYGNHGDKHYPQLLTYDTLDKKENATLNITPDIWNRVKNEFPFNLMNLSYNTDNQIDNYSLKDFAAANKIYDNLTQTEYDKFADFFKDKQLNDLFKVNVSQFVSYFDNAYKTAQSQNLYQPLDSEDKEYLTDSDYQIDLSDEYANLSDFQKAYAITSQVKYTNDSDLQTVGNVLRNRLLNKLSKKYDFDLINQKSVNYYVAQAVNAGATNYMFGDTDNKMNVNDFVRSVLNDKDNHFAKDTVNDYYKQYNKNVKSKDGINETIKQLKAENADFKIKIHNHQFELSGIRTDMVKNKNQLLMNIGTFQWLFKGGRNRFNQLRSERRDLHDNEKNVLAKIKDLRNGQKTNKATIKNAKRHTLHTGSIMPITECDNLITQRNGLHAMAHNVNSWHNWTDLKKNKALTDKLVANRTAYQVNMFKNIYGPKFSTQKATMNVTDTLNTSKGIMQVSKAYEPLVRSQRNIMGYENQLRLDNIFQQNVGGKIHVLDNGEYQLIYPHPFGNQFDIAYTFTMPTQAELTGTVDMLTKSSNPMVKYATQHGISLTDPNVWKANNQFMNWIVMNTMPTVINVDKNALQPIQDLNNQPIKSWNDLHFAIAKNNQLVNDKHVGELIDLPQLDGSNAYKLFENDNQTILSDNVKDILSKKTEYLGNNRLLSAWLSGNYKAVAPYLGQDLLNVAFPSVTLSPIANLKNRALAEENVLNISPETEIADLKDKVQTAVASQKADTAIETEKVDLDAQIAKQKQIADANKVEVANRRNKQIADKKGNTAVKNNNSNNNNNSNRIVPSEINIEPVTKVKPADMEVITPDIFENKSALLVSPSIEKQNIEVPVENVDKHIYTSPIPEPIKEEKPDKVVTPPVVEETMPLTPTMQQVNQILANDNETQLQHSYQNASPTDNIMTDITAHNSDLIKNNRPTDTLFNSIMQNLAFINSMNNDKDKELPWQNELSLKNSVKNVEEANNRIVRWDKYLTKKDDIDYANEHFNGYATMNSAYRTLQSEIAYKLKGDRSWLLQRHQSKRDDQNYQIGSALDSLANEFTNPNEVKEFMRQMLSKRALDDLNRMFNNRQMLSKAVNQNDINIMKAEILRRLLTNLTNMLGLDKDLDFALKPDNENIANNVNQTENVDNEKERQIIFNYYNNAENQGKVQTPNSDLWMLQELNLDKIKKSSALRKYKENSLNKKIA